MLDGESDQLSKMFQYTTKERIITDVWPVAYAPRNAALAIMIFCGEGSDSAVFAAITWSRNGPRRDGLANYDIK